MIKYRNKRAQVTAEYALMAACIIAALVVMQHYIKRAAQGRLREAADSISGQYDPKHISSRIVSTESGKTTISSERKEEASVEAEEGRIFGTETVSTTENEVIRRFGYESLEEFQGELFE